MVRIRARGRMMRQRSNYESVDPAYRRSSNVRQSCQPAPAALRTGNCLAVSCLFFGAAFTALFVPASLEQRIEILFFFGLVPAAGLYAGAHVLSRLLIVGTKLCEMIATCCFRCFELLANSFVIWVSPPVSAASIGCLMVPARCLLAKASALGEKACRSISHRYLRAHAAFVEFLCLLIRSAARFVISWQASYACRVSDASRSGWRLGPLIMVGMLFAAFGLGWWGGVKLIWPPDLKRDDLTGGAAIDSVVERIISIESSGDPNAKNKRSSATGLGQFLDETWLDLIRTHRPDLARGRGQDKTLELRRDAKIAREITTRFTEQNAQMLRKKGLPVTPGTLYLAHFAGGAGAVAILSALKDADAAAVMAGADATGRTKREKIIKANPFLERFTVADLRSWADRKMRVPGS
jgi:hypothetical protein